MVSSQEPVDWNRLQAAALEAAAHAHAPYSGLKVGAAGLIDDGRIVVGCNVESASYGLTLCAECGLVSILHASGGGSLVAVVVVDSSGQALSPCGRCRQLLMENGGEATVVRTPSGDRTLGELLPEPFGPSDVG